LSEQFSKRKVKACLLRSNFIDPQGLSLSVAQKKTIVALAEQHQVAIIEDDVYLEVGFSKVAPLPIKHWDKQDWVLWCGSVSKILAADYRLGWCEAGRFSGRYIEYLSGRSLGINGIVHSTVAEFIDTGQYIKHLAKLKLAAQAFDYHQVIRLFLGEKLR
jgi:DNA-binding transcriptional MocR family regulator